MSSGLLQKLARSAGSSGPGAAGAGSARSRDFEVLLAAKATRRHGQLAPSSRAARSSSARCGCAAVELLDAAPTGVARSPALGLPVVDAPAHLRRGREPIAQPK